MSCSRLRWPSIVLLGDSQTQFGYESGWISQLSNHYQRRCDIINRGFSGYNSRWLKVILHRIVDKDLASSCKAVAVFVGSNDANDEKINPAQHVPLPEYTQNLLDICSSLQKTGLQKEQIVLISPPPVIPHLWKAYRSQQDGADVEVGLTTELTSAYADACVGAADKAGVHSIHLHNHMTKIQDWEKFVNEDGLHLTGSGGQLLAELLIQRLDEDVFVKENKLPDRVFALWKDVDNANPAPSLLK